MKHDRATEEIRELAALYALGALTQQEARGFEIHLAEGCGVCRAEQRRFARAAATLGLAAEERRAPEYLRDILLERIEREPQAPDPGAPQSTGPEEESGRILELPPAEASPAGGGSGRHGFGRSLPWLLAAVCAALALGGGFAWKSARTDAGRLRAELAEAAEGAGRTGDELRTLRARSADLDTILEMTRRQGVQSTHLVGQPATPANSGMLLWDAGRRRCLVIASFLPAPRGQVYQLWFSTPEARVPVGVLEADAGGRILARLRTPEGLERALSAVVTLEPAPGSVSPEGPFCATGSFR
ncbi:MAG: anti-sigma factor [Acidobacteria bacterium]|nr:anti-sigma factor [Acidobacteriota bacterium]